MVCCRLFWLSCITAFRAGACALMSEASISRQTYQICFQPLHISDLHGGPCCITVNTSEFVVYLTCPLCVTGLCGLSPPPVVALASPTHCNLQAVWKRTTSLGLSRRAQQTSVGTWTWPPIILGGFNQPVATAYVQLSDRSCHSQPHRCQTVTYLT